MKFQKIFPDDLVLKRTELNPTKINFFSGRFKDCVNNEMLFIYHAPWWRVELVVA